MKAKIKLSRLFPAFLFMTGMLFISSCEELVMEESHDQQEISKSTAVQPEDSKYKSVMEPNGFCGETVLYKLYAGQNIDAGYITINNDNDYLYVTYNTTGGWALKCTQLYVGSLEDIPANKKGNPQIGHFPYKNCPSSYQTEHTYKIPLDEVDECFIVAAHAEVVLLDEEGEEMQEETAWGDGKAFNDKGSWAMYMNYCLQECEPCEITPVLYRIYLLKTIHVGKITITNDDSNLYVSYLTRNNTYMSATHLFVGSLENLPTNDANEPVQEEFPYIQEHNPLTQTYTYTIPLEGLPECYIIAAHATANKVIDGVIEATESAWGDGERYPDTEGWATYSPYCTQSCD